MFHPLLAIVLNKSGQLYQAKSSAYFGETRDRISRLFRLTVQTGFLTAVLAIPIAPLYVAVPGTEAYSISYVDSLYAHLGHDL